MGPFLTLQIGGGKSAEYYLLRYGKDGGLLSPRTEGILKSQLGAASDVFLFSHGWNNTFDDAARHYRSFVDGYMSQSDQHPANYQPVLVGVVWPSASFVLPWEDGPEIAAGPPDAARVEEMRGFIGESLDTAAEAELSELVDGRAELDAADARKAAMIVQAALRADGDPDDGSPPPTVDELLEAWALLDGGSAAKPADPDDFGDAGIADSARPGGAAPQVAGGAGRFDPRNLLRMGTVWKMKDRAGTVGARGVAPLVRHILDSTTARLHLVGHSFGARLVLSALAVAAPSRRARSMLLLQPAINRWCFADDVVGTGRRGGYHAVPELVDLPVLATMSRHDFPLRDAFHLAVRGSSLGEPNIAAVGDTDRYGALGGYGPAGLGSRGRTRPVVRAGEPYDLSGGRGVIALDGSGEIDGSPAIGGHSDISNSRTWWALHCLTAAT